MTRIGGGGQPPKEADALHKNEEAADLRTKEGVQKFKEAAQKQNVPGEVVDKFVRSGHAIEKQLQTLSGKALAGKLNFSSAELAQIAATFAATLKQFPRADRKDRARMFAKAMLKQKMIGKLLDEAPEAEVERLFENIAEQLDGSPVFAQLVDEVTEGARKITLG